MNNTTHHHSTRSSRKTGFSRSVPLLLAAMGSLLPTAAWAQAEYRAVIIEPWDQDYQLASSRAAGINIHNVVSGCAKPLSGSCSYLWTLEGGKEQVNLGGAINDDGYVAGGDALREPGGDLIDLDGVGTAQDLNNGLVVVGAATGRYWGGCRYTREAKVWDPDHGARSLDIDFGVPSAHEARAVNNANEVVGVRSWTGDCADFEAFYLNLDTGEHIDIHAELLGGASGITQAYDINDAGVVAGDGPFDGEQRAFLWSRDAGFDLLPTLPGTLQGHSRPSAINSDGDVVGQAIVNGEWRAWMWDAQRGIRDLNELAEDLPTDFIVEDSIGINNNGWIIARGHYGAWSPERAVVLIPLELGCPADFNTDGTANTLDVLAFLNAWSAGDPAADFNADGTVNTLDVLAFLNAWSAGDTSADFNQDGTVNTLDVLAFLNAWSAGC